MALNIKNAEVEQLAGEVASLSGETKTEAVRRALAERRERLRLASPPGRRGESFLRYLREEVWPQAPAGAIGQPLTKEEEAEILGYGPEGV